MTLSRSFLHYLSGWARLLTDIVVLTAVLSLGRYAFLLAAGDALILEDMLHKGDAIVVLSGGAEDRARLGAKLLMADWAPRLYATGELVPRTLREVGLSLSEGELTLRMARQYGADSTRLALLPAGTSTWEECQLLAQRAKSLGWKRIILVSARHHTYRIQQVVDRTLRPAGIEVLVQGAPSSVYAESHWWREEEGFLFVFNEYLKLLYYRLKYF